MNTRKLFSNILYTLGAPMLGYCLYWLYAYVFFGHIAQSPDRIIAAAMAATLMLGVGSIVRA